MFTRTIKCPYGHKFEARIFARRQSVSCPRCEDSIQRVRAVEQAEYVDNAVLLSPATPSFYVDSTPAEVTPSFLSGSGGDFGGGGATASWSDTSPSYTSSSSSSDSCSSSSYSSSDSSSSSSSSDSGSSSFSSD